MARVQQAGEAEKNEPELGIPGCHSNTTSVDAREARLTVSVGLV